MLSLILNTDKTFPYITPKNYLIFDLTIEIDTLVKQTANVNDINEDDKIGFDTQERIFYIDKNTMFQSVCRWYNKQNREKTIYYIQSYIKNVIDVSTRFMSYIENNIIEKNKIQEYEKPIMKLHKLFLNLEQIINTIHKTYQKQYDETEHKYIQILIDLKNMVNDIIKYKNILEQFFMINKNNEYGNYVFHMIQSTTTKMYKSVPDTESDTNTNTNIENTKHQEDVN